MTEEWSFTIWQRAGPVVLAAAIVYAAVITLNLLNGLRSFSRMSAFVRYDRRRRHAPRIRARHP